MRREGEKERRREGEKERRREGEKERRREGEKERRREGEERRNSYLTASRAEGNPSCLQTTNASSYPHTSSQMVPH